MAPRLKVFSWSDGFHSWTVATPSRPKALEAWNIEQDLFKSGLAHEVAEGPEREAALADRGTVIKTGMAIDPGAIEAVKPDPELVKRRKAKERADEIQAQIDEVDEKLSATLSPLKAKREKLEGQIEQATEDAERERKSLFAKLKATGR